VAVRLRIGELLIKAGLLTQEQLETALAEQRNSGGSERRLGQLLVDLKFVSEVQLTKILSNQLSVPWVSLHHIDFSRQLLNLVPREIAEQFCVVPVYVRHERKAGDTLYLAMEDPTHDEAIRRVTAASGMPVKSMIAPPSDIRGALAAYYGAAPVDAAPATSAPAQGSHVSAEPPAPPIAANRTASASVQRGEAAAAKIVTENDDSEDLSIVEDISDDVEATDDDEAVVDVEIAAADVTDRLPVATASTPPETPAVPEAAPISDAPATAPADAPPVQPAGEVVTEPVAPKPRRKAPPGRPATVKPGPRMLALTFLDGTTLQIPAQKRRDRPADEPTEPQAPGDHEAQLTARDLVVALRAVARGAAAPDEALGDARWETLFAALLSVLMKKQLIADWEFVEAWKKM